MKTSCSEATAMAKTTAWMISSCLTDVNILSFLGSNKTIVYIFLNLAKQPMHVYPLLKVSAIDRSRQADVLPSQGVAYLVLLSEPLRTTCSLTHVRMYYIRSQNFDEGHLE